MNYKKIYDDLMQSRLLMKEARISARKAGEYFESHHIVPVSMGGDGKRWQFNHSNIVLLTGREHYIAHALLFVTHETFAMIKSFQMMCTVKRNGKRNYTVSARLYEELKIKLSKNGLHPNARKGIIKANTGRKLSDETKRKIGMGNKGKKYPFRPIRVVSNNTRKKMSQSQKLRHELNPNKKRKVEPAEKFLNKKRTQYIIDLLNSGYSVRQIQRTLNCSPNLVVKIRTKLNMTKCHTT